MSTAFNRPSMWKRVGALALAGTIALGTLIPGNGLVSADSGSESTVTPTPSATFELPPDSGLTGVTAVVVAGGADLLADPAEGSTVLARLDAGTVVDLRIDAVDTVTDEHGTRWWPVTANGQDGWIAGNFLADATAVTPVPTGITVMTPTVVPTGTVSGGGADEEFDFTGEIVPGIQAIVAGDGGPVNMRAEA
ncbi:MAG TPA: SH3 domain-containing protein, partial [Thermomicrobiales bacterium]|nr:SH3 domain-containing protein [Thermomicrobiales bacterium]